MDKTEESTEAVEAMNELQIRNHNDGFCDCNDVKCVGCFWPCEKCESAKCGHVCRVNRSWKYEKWEKQGQYSTE